MRFRKCAAVLVSIAFGCAPTLALAQAAKPPLAFQMPPVAVVKGVPFAWSLCTNAAVPAAGQGATGGFGCSGVNPAVRGGCPPYRFRLAGVSDTPAGFNRFLPPGVFLEANGVIHGTVTGIGALTRSAGAVCVEDSCGSAPACRQLELKPVNPDPRTLSSDRATLGEIPGGAAPPERATNEVSPRFNAEDLAPKPDGGQESEGSPESEGTPNATAAPKKGGGGFGTAALVTLGALAAVGAAVAAKGAGTSEGGGDSSCPSLSRCCSNGSGSGCGIPAQCRCPGNLFDGGICQAGGGCARFFTPGSRICNGC